MSNDSARSEARSTALEFLYEAAIREEAPTKLFEGASGEDAFVLSLLEKVENSSADLESLIEKNLSEGWALSRIPAIDVQILKLGIVELQAADAPAAVVLSEATKLAYSYSTEESAKFVNGLLATIANEL